MKPHSHAAIIKAWADGAKIEVNNGQNDIWSYVEKPSWEYRNKYRVALPKPDVVVYSRIMGKFMFTSEGLEIQQLIACEVKDRPNIKYTFDGEWGTLKFVELLK